MAFYRLLVLGTLGRCWRAIKTAFRVCRLRVTTLRIRVLITCRFFCHKPWWFSMLRLESLKWEGDGPSGPEPTCVNVAVDLDCFEAVAVGTSTLSGGHFILGISCTVKYAGCLPYAAFALFKQSMLFRIRPFCCWSAASRHLSQWIGDPLFLCLGVHGHVEGATR